MSKLFGRWEAVLVGLIGVVLLAGWLMSPYFLQPINIGLAIGSESIPALMAVGLGWVVLTGEIDISVGSMVAMCSVTMGFLFEHGVPAAVCVLAAIAMGAVCGAFNALLVKIGISSLVATLGTLSLYSGLSYVFLGNGSYHDFPPWLISAGGGFVGRSDIPWTGVVFVVVSLGLAVFASLGRYGRKTYAVGDNPNVARYSGFSVMKMKTVVLMVSGAITGLAAVLYTGEVANAQANNGSDLLLYVLTIVVLGGISFDGGSGSIFGIWLSGILIALLQSLLALKGMNQSQQDLAIGMLLLVSIGISKNGAAIIKLVSWRRERPLPKVVVVAGSGVQVAVLTDEGGGKGE